MDGITGLTSIVPMMPEQSIITDRSGVNGPPVEIMPLPSNSFMSDDAQAELLNNPFTLSLDIKGYHDGETSGGKGVGTASQTGITTADDEVADVLLNHAYTLSLGNEENIPITTEIAREMSRMKNYEMLGKSGTRQTYRMNPDTGAAENITLQSPDNATIEMISEKVRSQLAQSDLFLPQIRGAGPASPEIITEGPADAPQLAPPGGTPLSSDNRQNRYFLSNLPAFQLSASDIEAVLTLEPDLQEALLNMLSNVNRGDSDRTRVEPNEALYNSKAGELPVGANTQNKQAYAPDNPAAFIDKNLLINAQPGIILQTLNHISRPPEASEIKLMKDIPDNAQLVAFTDEELTRLTADSMTGGKALGALSANTLRGSMLNLQKVNELPYSLYIFGNVIPDRRGNFEETADPALSVETSIRKTGPTEFLRISEAIKMASVLHNIYYGGSGRFPQETPWYEPYVRYAIKNGIIKNNAFDDYNELATRAETAYIFAGCVPRAELPMINIVSDIPDVSEAFGYGDSVYLLYRAGVLTNGNKTDSFYPERMITKTEAATIIGRIATPGDRKRIL